MPGNFSEDDNQDYNHGKYWVNFGAGVVECIAPKPFVCTGKVK